MTSDQATLRFPAPDLDHAVAAAEASGFRLDATGPADDPTWAELSQGATTLIIDTTLDPSGGPQAMAAGDPDDVRALRVPATEPAHVVSHQASGDWSVGRAGMRYRDLIPDRYGGAYIASHIHVPDGGPVPDYVHHHDIVHQLIYCHRGWAEVVYQDQGPPLTMQPGDCILQPPGIRHQ
ncbi:MAG: cupin, partial [Actinomycetota bacterium]